MVLPHVIAVVACTSASLATGASSSKAVLGSTRATINTNATQPNDATSEKGGAKVWGKGGGGSDGSAITGAVLSAPQSSTTRASTSLTEPIFLASGVKHEVFHHDGHHNVQDEGYCNMQDDGIWYGNVYESFSKSSLSSNSLLVDVALLAMAVFKSVPFPLLWMSLICLAKAAETAPTPTVSQRPSPASTTGIPTHWLNSYLIPLTPSQSACALPFQYPNQLDVFYAANLNSTLCKCLGGSARYGGQTQVCVHLPSISSDIQSAQAQGSGSGLSIPSTLILIVGLISLAFLQNLALPLLGMGMLSFADAVETTLTPNISSLSTTRSDVPATNTSCSGLPTLNDFQKNYSEDITRAAYLTQTYLYSAVNGYRALCECLESFYISRFKGHSSERIINQGTTSNPGSKLSLSPFCTVRLFNLTVLQGVLLPLHYSGLLGLAEAALSSANSKFSKQTYDEDTATTNEQFVDHVLDVGHYLWVFPGLFLVRSSCRATSIITIVVLQFVLDISGSAEVAPAVTTTMTIVIPASTITISVVLQPTELPLTTSLIYSSSTQDAHPAPTVQWWGRSLPGPTTSCDTMRRKV